MNPRTRAVLAVLGVPVWAARQHAVRQVTPTPIWRDVTEEVVPRSEALVRLGTHEKVVQVSVPNRHAPPPSVVQARPIPITPQHRAVEAKAPIVQPVAVEATAVRFAVEVLVLQSWLLVVPSQQLADNACRQLWEQIQLVFAKQPVEWFWPLAEGARWQTAPYAAVALQGFFARLAPQARVGLMGELPDQALPERVERLPSLQQLIEQPLQKRTLWQLLQAELIAS